MTAGAKPRPPWRRRRCPVPFGVDVTKTTKTPRQQLLKAADVPGADAHPLMKSDADRLRDARWGAKLNGWLAAVRSAPPRYCLCSGFAVGDMIRCEGGCDGWFHLACLAASARPFERRVDGV